MEAKPRQKSKKKNRLNNEVGKKIQFHFFISVQKMSNHIIGDDVKPFLIVSTTLTVLLIMYAGHIFSHSGYEFVPRWARGSL